MAVAEALKHKPLIPGERDRRKETLRRALEGLAEGGFIELNGTEIVFRQE